jgi:hypothetical protein
MHRVWRLSAIVLLLTTFGLFVGGRWTSPVISVAGVHAAARRDFLSITIGSEPVSGNGERWRFANGATAILGPQSLWLPSRTGATVSTTAWIGWVSSVFVPWRFLLSASIAVAIGLWWLGRRASTPAGACPRCGYDLEGNTTGCCPECGRRG